MSNLASRFLHNISWSVEDAESKTNEFEGFGPEIYLVRQSNWKEFIGNSGSGLYTHLLTIRGERGAVPKGIGLAMVGLTSGRINQNLILHIDNGVA
jgi:hypothetical protein